MKTLRWTQNFVLPGCDAEEMMIVLNVLVDWLETSAVTRSL